MVRTGKQGPRALTALLLMVALVLALGASGCAEEDDGGSATEDASDGGATEAADGSAASDGLVLAIGGVPDDGFDPTVGWGRYGSPLFQSTLLMRDDQLKIVNDLATDVQVSDDHLTYTVSIRDDVVFSDGEPLTAEDVVYTFETAKESGSAIDLTMLEDAVALDEHTVEFTLDAPASTFMNRLVELGIVPEHAHGPDYRDAPVGSGPYAFVQWDVGEQLIVEANPEYYGPEPEFDRITFLFLAEDAAFAAAKAGEVDVAAVPPSFARETVEGMEVLPVDSVDNRGIIFPMVPDEGETTEDGYPIGNDVTSDEAIRRAVDVAVDREALVDGVLYGYGRAAYSLTDGLPWGPEGVEVDDRDAEKAEAILADAGWTDADGDGILEKDDLEARFTLLYPAEDSLRQALALSVSDTLGSLGIDVPVEGKSWDEIETLMHSQATVMGWGSQDPSEVYYVYHGSYAGEGFYNPGYYRNGEVDEQLDEAVASGTEEAAIPHWQQAQELAAEDLPWVWLVNLDHAFLVREGLDLGNQRIQPHGHGWPLTANIVDWRSDR
jgi:peptide/nickel transport system substrate-binding protein